MDITAALYLVPVGISDAPIADVLPSGNLDVLHAVRHFIVENLRTARRFLRRCDPAYDIDSCTFHELNRHTDLSEVSSWLDPLRQGLPMAVMSEAGCPAVADPGALPAMIAQREGLRVIPLVGPSSILMSLMASGFNGQGFSFNGYLPIEESAKVKKIKELESLSSRLDMTQIFIETPYRNGKMLDMLVRTLHPDTRICVACDITDPDREMVRTLTAKQWKSMKCDIDKRPAIFLVYAGKGIRG